MSRLFPHPPYAEDQPLSRTVLATHVLTRGATSGAIVGLAIAAGRESLRRFRSTPLPASSPGLATQFLRGAGVGTVWGTGFLALGLAGRMWGRQEIEWQDRSWRLLENEGQLETDDWTYGGALAGLAGVVLAARAGGLGGIKALTWRGVLGGAGAGSAAGTFGYLGWRYGVKQGKFPKKETSAQARAA
ncbi:hypothetical protein GQ53DRAFT_753329 [Thozetella sp. PMI_491]|nr:hypothetical protein GQ53DRAFT_753329 [Thozetella sp. PMI_491]